MILHLRHNSLPHPEDQPEISDASLKALGELFVHHGVQDTFGIHLLHSHFTAPEGTVLLGVEAQLSGNSSACWTKPVPVAELANKAVHGHVFRLQSDGIFVAYELQEGTVHAAAADTGPEFFLEFASFLRKNSLTNLVALQLLDGSQHKTRMELLVGEQQTLMVDEKDLVGFDPPRITTGWSFHVGDDGIISCKGNDVYASKKDTHQVFQDSKPLPNVKALVQALREAKVIA